MQKSLVTALATWTTLTGTAYADVIPPGASESDANGGWFATVDKTLEEQPHWVCPLVTVFPQLVEEYRYDEIVQNKVGGVTLSNDGGGVRGLELIPSEHVEILIGQPGYMNLQTPQTTISGWTDETLLMKYRFLAANEENGNYVVSGFMGVSLPTGSTPFTQNATVTTPTLAVGKGWV